jgi:hypothetical protein
MQSKETTILTDPVWLDYLWEEINVLCPHTELDKDTIPPVERQRTIFSTTILSIWQKMQCYALNVFETFGSNSSYF